MACDFARSLIFFFLFHVVISRYVKFVGYLIKSLNEPFARCLLVLSTWSRGTTCLINFRNVLLYRGNTNFGKKIYRRNKVRNFQWSMKKFQATNSLTYSRTFDAHEMELLAGFIESHEGIASAWLEPPASARSTSLHIASLFLSFPKTRVSQMLENGKPTPRNIWLTPTNLPPNDSRMFNCLSKSLGANAPVPRLQRFTF